MSDHAAFEARLATLEAVVTTPKIGLVDTVVHMHECVESIKATIWKATGALAALFIIAQWLLK